MADRAETPARHRASQGRRWVAPRGFAAAGVFTVCLALLLRHPAHGSMWHTLWAEDGRDFLSCELEHGAACITTPYQGYLHAAPRLLFMAVPLFPVAVWPVVVTLLALTVAAFCLVTVYRTTTWLVSSALARTAIVFIVATSAAAHLEAAGNLANLHWFLLVSALFVAVNPDAIGGMPEIALRVGWLAFACLSEALALLIAGAYLVGLVLRQRRRGTWSRTDVIAGALVVIGAGVQSGVHFFDPRPEPHYPPQSVRAALADYWAWVPRNAWTGANTAGTTMTKWVLIVLAGLLIIGAVHRRVDWMRVVAGACLLVLSVAVFLLLVLINHGVAPRYSFVPFVLALVGIAALFDGVFTGATWANVGIPAATGAILLAVLVIGPPNPLVADRGPSWRSQITAAEHLCAAGKGTSEFVTTAPTVPTLWGVRLSCGILG